MAELTEAQLKFIEDLLRSELDGDTDTEYYMMDMDELIEEFREELDKL
jgi:hypothetical protein